MAAINWHTQFDTRAFMDWGWYPGETPENQLVVSMVKFENALSAVDKNNKQTVVIIPDQFQNFDNLASVLSSDFNEAYQSISIRNASGGDTVEVFLFDSDHSALPMYINGGDINIGGTNVPFQIENLANAGLPVFSAIADFRYLGSLRDNSPINALNTSHQLITVAGVDESRVPYDHSAKAGNGVSVELAGVNTSSIPKLDHTSDSSLVTGYTRDQISNSIAASSVAGIASLLLDYGASKGINLEQEDVRNILNRTTIDVGDSGFDTRTGHGLVDAQAALQFLDNYLVSHLSGSPVHQQNNNSYVDVPAGISARVPEAFDNDGWLRFNSSSSIDFQTAATISSSGSNLRFQYKRKPNTSPTAPTEVTVASRFVLDTLMRSANLTSSFTANEDVLFTGATTLNSGQTLTVSSGAEVFIDSLFTMGSSTSIIDVYGTLKIVTDAQINSGNINVLNGGKVEIRQGAVLNRTEIYVANGAELEMTGVTHTMEQYDGIDAYGKVTFSGCTFERTGTTDWDYIALTGSGANGSLISHSTIKGSRYGLHVNAVSNLQITAVSCDDNYYSGVKLINSTANFIGQSTFTNNEYDGVGAWTNTTANFKEGLFVFQHNRAGIRSKDSFVAFGTHGSASGDCVIQDNYGGLLAYEYGEINAGIYIPMGMGIPMIIGAWNDIDDNTYDLRIGNHGTIVAQANYPGADGSFVVDPYGSPTSYDISYAINWDPYPFYNKTADPKSQEFAQKIVDSLGVLRQSPISRLRTALKSKARNRELPPFMEPASVNRSTRLIASQEQAKLVAMEALSRIQFGDLDNGKRQAAYILKNPNLSEADRAGLLVELLHLVDSELRYIAVSTTGVQLWVKNQSARDTARNSNSMLFNAAINARTSESLPMI